MQKIILRQGKSKQTQEHTCFNQALPELLFCKLRCLRFRTSSGLPPTPNSRRLGCPKPTCYGFQDQPTGHHQLSSRTVFSGACKLRVAKAPSCRTSQEQLISIKCEMIPSCSQVACVGGNDPMARMLSISPSVTGQKHRLTQEKRQHHCDPRGVQADLVEGKYPTCFSPKLGQLWAHRGQRTCFGSAGRWGENFFLHWW